MHQVHWIGRGGTATSVIYSSNQSLVVNQSGVVHKSIADLLDTLTKLANEEVSFVEYDLSAIVDVKAEKSSREQMDAACSIAADRFSGIGYPAMDLVCNPDSLVVTAKTTGHMHDEMNLYFESLREARKVITEVDHP